MAIKGASKPPAYERLPRFLRTLREEAGLTQRGVGQAAEEGAELGLQLRDRQPAR